MWYVEVYQFECPPRITYARDLEKHKLRRSERVDILQRHRGNDASNEPTPHHVALVAEREGIELLKAEEHPS